MNLCFFAVIIEIRGTALTAEAEAVYVYLVGTSQSSYFIDICVNVLCVLRLTLAPIVGVNEYVVGGIFNALLCEFFHEAGHYGLFADILLLTVCNKRGHSRGLGTLREGIEVVFR